MNTKSSTSPSIEPEWIRVSEACTFARVSKPVLYGWLNRGLIRNFSARQRGQIKGTRLISLQSLRSFLDSHATGGLSQDNHPEKQETRTM